MSNMAGTDDPLEVFYSYAHEDEKLREELEKHLSLLKRQGVVSGWHDREITAGSQWKDQIDGHLESAKIILLLVSADFLASDYCYDIEMKRALERHAHGEARVIPILLRPVDWQGAPFGHLQCLPKDAIALTSWPNRDEAFLDIAQGIRKSAQAMRQTKHVGPAASPVPTAEMTLAYDILEPPKSGLMGVWEWLTETNMKKLAFIGTLIAAVAGGSWTVYTYIHPSMVQSDGSAQMVTQGNDLLDIGRYPEAKQAFEEAIKSNPLNSQAAWGLKKAKLWESSNPAVFEQAIKSLYQVNPKDAHVNFFLGKFYASDHTAEGNKQAIEYYQKAIELNPELAEAYFDLGVLYDQSGKKQEAESAYLKAIAISKETPKYRNNLAYLYFKQKKYPEAMEEYGKNSQFPLSALESAKIYWQLGKVEQARDYQRQAIKWLDDEKVMAKPEQQDPWYFDMGKDGVELVSLSEKKSYAYLCLSVSQYLLGQTRDAEEIINKLRELNLPQQSNINDILRVDLYELETNHDALAKQVDAYKKHYLPDSTKPVAYTPDENRVLGDSKIIGL